MDLSHPSAPTRPSTGRRRRLRRVVAALALGDLGVLVAAPAFAVAPAPFSLQVSANQAIFQVTALKPGPVGQRCLVLQAVNGTASLALLSAQVGGSGLAAYLDLTIEQGPAGGASSCATMPANLLFTGSLAQLATTHPDAARGLAIPFAPSTSDTAIRLTAALRDDNGAQGLDATATFSFQADDTSVPPAPTTTAPATTVATTAPTTVSTTAAPATAPPAPATTGAPAGTAGPTPATTAAVPPSAAGRPTTSAPRAVTPAVTSSVASSSSTTATTAATTTTASTAAGTSAVTRTSRVAATTIPGGPATTTAPPSNHPASIKVSDPTATDNAGGVTWSSIPEAVKTTVALTAKASSVPALFLGLVFVFLVLQDRIDRNDPKLARAPMRPDPEILFLPRSQVVR